MLVEFLFNYVYDKSFVYQLVATLVTYFIINVALFIRQRRKRFLLLKYYGIPGPEPRLLDGNLHNFAKLKPFYYKVDEEFIKTYGKTFGIYFGDEPCLRTTDLALLKKVFLENTNSFKDRGRTHIKTPFVDGILFCNYDRWKVFRRVMSPLFSSYIMRGASSTMFIDDSIKLMVDYIDTKLAEAKAINEDARIDMHDLMKSTALHMISNMAVKLPDVQVKENEEHVKSLDSMLSQSDKGLVVYAIMFPFLARIISFLATHLEHNNLLSLIRRGLNDRIDRMIEQYNKESSANDVNDKFRNQQKSLIDLLIRLCYEGKISRNEVLANAEAVLIAGYDTTSTTLTYVFWVLGKYPQIQEKLRHELMAHGVDSKYLEQVINETMRLYPTVVSFTSRVATKTVELDNLIIPQGTKVVHHTWLVHRDPSIWPQPEKFYPDRFRDGVEIHPCAFAPFGLGERKCLGYNLAYLEMKMILCDILLRYKIKLKAPDDLELISYASVITKPKDKVILCIEPL